MLLLTIVVQNVMGQTSLLAVHVPLGVAILGLTGTLLGRTRNLVRGPADADAAAPLGDPYRTMGIRSGLR